MTAKDFCNKVKIKTTVFVILVLLTIIDIGLIIGGGIVISNVDRSNKGGSFTFVVLIIATIVVGILFCIILYVWIADYFLKEVKKIVRILNTKKLKRRRSVQDV